MSNNNRDGSNKDMNNSRKSSVSQGFTNQGGFTTNSSRNNVRRRDQTDPYSSTNGSGKDHDDNLPSSPEPRRHTFDSKAESVDEKFQMAEADGGLPGRTGLPSLDTNNHVSTSHVAPSSPWGTQSPGFSPMGAFGNFGSGTVASDRRPGLVGGRAESRFKGLMLRDNNHDELTKPLREMQSIGDIGKGSSNTSWRSGKSDLKQLDLSDDENDIPSGSAALGGGEELSPPQPRKPEHTLGRSDKMTNGYGFSAFGMTPDKSALRGFDQAIQSGTMSPTSTNPYQSPQPNQSMNKEHDLGDVDYSGLALPNFSGLGQTDTNSLSSGFGSQFPSFGGGSNALSGLGASSGPSALSQWNTGPSNSGTPTRERPQQNFFGDNALSGLGDRLSGLGSGSLLGLGVNPSRIHGASDFLNQGNSCSTVDAVTPQRNHGSLQTHDDSDDAQQVSQVQQEPQMSHVNENLSQSQSLNNSSFTAQQRTMVMPDRMRWIYRDPQGNTQGPWSGLEMHDWYKAGFFSPELLVKKYEDNEYEPLAQLIRRIGNSREPFLVPQIGIAHGESQSGWAAGSSSTASAQQPPFAASFPSFGTTLTAEQQNALERRKQEEQYLMARQKEHLAKQQIAQRQPGIGPLSATFPHHVQTQQGFDHFGPMPGLNSNALGGPTYFDPLANQLRSLAALVSVQNQGISHGNYQNENQKISKDENHNLPMLSRRDNVDEHFPISDINQGGFGADDGAALHQHDSDPSHHSAVNQMLKDRSRLQQEQDLYHQTHQTEHMNLSLERARFEEFQRLQQEHLQQQQSQIGQSELNESDMYQEQPHRRNEDYNDRNGENIVQSLVNEPKSLTEQVQQAVSAAKHSPSATGPWAKIESSLPTPFPPAPSQSPLPAPAAQRNRSHVAEALHVESHSRSNSPSIESASVSIAPWAKEPTEAPKGPSLKEIQEVEAKNAAKLEAIAAEARRVALEREALAQIQAMAIATAAQSAGLPLSSNWAASPPIVSSSNSAWAKTTSAEASTAVASGKKTVKEIQEEEGRQKQAEIAQLAAKQQQANAAGIAAAQMQGKRYAELASKIATSTSLASTPSNNSGNAWTTVGAVGKVKTPATVSTIRTPSITSVPANVSANRKSSTVGRTFSGSTTTAVGNAQDEFKRWAAGELRGDLNTGVIGESFTNHKHITYL